MIRLFLSYHQGKMQANNVHIFKVRLFTLVFSSSNSSCDKITNKTLKMLYCWELLCVVVCTRCAGDASYSTDYWTAVTSSAIIHVHRKYQVFRVVCSERVHYANATHLPRNLAHAYIAFWTGIISWSVDSTYALVAKGKVKGRLGNANRRGNISIKIRVNEQTVKIWVEFTRLDKGTNGWLVNMLIKARFEALTAVNQQSHDAHTTTQSNTNHHNIFLIFYL